MMRRVCPARGVSIWLLALALILAGMGPAADVGLAQELVPVKMTIPVGAFSFLSVFVAEDAGFFKEEGLDVEVIMTGGDGPDVQALIAGDVQFTVTPPSRLLLAHQEGIDLWAIASIMNRSNINFVIHKDVAAARGITADSPLPEKLQALKGLTIGATQPAALTYILAAYYTQRGGWTPQEDVTILAVGGGPSMLAALERKRIDIMSLASPFPEEAIHQGYGEWFINMSAGEDPELDEFLFETLYVRPAYARENPDITRAMVRALVRANRWIVETPADQVALLMAHRFEGVSEEVMIAGIEAVKMGTSPTGEITRASFDAFQKVMLETGFITDPVPFENVINNSFLPQ